MYVGINLKMPDLVRSEVSDVNEVPEDEGAVGMSIGLAIGNDSAA
jgi:hypothetical protein